MAEMLMFHHAQGLTAGCLAFAEQLRDAGHVVHTPDLYDGKTFTDLDAGIAYRDEIGFDTFMQRALRTAAGLPDALVYAGFSLGAMPAQMLAQTRRGAKGVVLLHSAAPATEFGDSWPAGVPLQIHTMENDDWGDVDVARELVRAVPGAELFLYPGDRHLFTDNSLSDYDATAATLVMQRVLGFLAALS